MVGKVTDASRRRMARRDEFVGLGPGYVTVESRSDRLRLPVLDVSITGTRDAERLAAELIELIRKHLERPESEYRLRMRRTA